MPSISIFYYEENTDIAKKSRFRKNNLVAFIPLRAITIYLKPLP